MSDELSSALRELAADGTTAPVVGGPATRARALRRRRRRRTAAALGAGASALALVGFGLFLRLGGDPDGPAGSRTPAAASSRSLPPSPATPGAASGALDLPGLGLTVDGRAMPVLSKVDLPSGLPDGTSMTVVAKKIRTALTVDVIAKGYAVVNVTHAVELRAGEGAPLYVGTVAPDVEAGREYDVQGALIALDPEDAQWLYARIRLGDSITVTTRATPSPATVAAAPSGTPTSPAPTPSPPAARPASTSAPAPAPRTTRTG
ncbi:hypothetical protein AB0G87_07190 [Streptomyces asoensis]|uniref:hypothetical protein n=1 Tax=Streptomyces asoensis TaxID=249586 RepID=UPI0033D7DE21